MCAVDTENAATFLLGTRNEALGANLSRGKVVRIAPHPVFARLDGAHQRMTRAAKMFRRVFVFRGIATAHVAALQAEAQMHPRIPCFHAILATVFVGACEFNLIEMAASFRHGFLLSARLSARREAFHRAALADDWETFSSDWRSQFANFAPAS